MEELLIETIHEIGNTVRNIWDISKKIKNHDGNSSMISQYFQPTIKYEKYCEKIRAIPKNIEKMGEIYRVIFINYSKMNLIYAT